MDERSELIDWIHLHDIKGVILVSGDLHSGGGIDDGTNSAFPEINVPHTNMPSGDTGELGTWSEGIVSGKDGRAGYALIHVSTEPVDTVLLEAKGREGGARVSYSITLP
jgi:alkaline phosphatase D